MNDSKRLLLDQGMHYYVAGRFSAQVGLVPTAGNLFHHALEMLLKAVLAEALPLDELKNRFRHRLLDLRADRLGVWDEFQRRCQDRAALDRFTHVIVAVNAFEEIRYPDKMLGTGFTVHIPIDASGASFVPPARLLDDSGRVAHVFAHYGFAVGEIDMLVVEILRRGNVNPRAIVMMLTEVAREHLLLQNAVAEAWRPT